MDLNYVISKRTGGANPFKIFEHLAQIDPDALAYAIKRMTYQRFMESAYWFAVATVAKSRAGMRCQICNSGTGIQVHHRTYDTHGREHSNMVDLVVLCENCHGLFHGHRTVEFLPQKPKRLTHDARPKLKGPLILPHSESDLPMPDGDTIILTQELLTQCRANGSFTNATLAAFGLTKSTMASGWPKRLLGTVLSREQYRKALEGKFIYRAPLAR